MLIRPPAHSVQDTEVGGGRDFWLLPEATNPVRSATVETVELDHLPLGSHTQPDWGTLASDHSNPAEPFGESAGGPARMRRNWHREQALSDTLEADTISEMWKYASGYRRYNRTARGSPRRGTGVS